MKSRLALVSLFVGLSLFLSACSSDQAQEITITTRTPVFIGQVYVGGAVNNPGLYPLKSDDSLADLISVAGGLKDGADPSQVRLFVATAGEVNLPQRIDINRAEAWLLEALPGIGQVTAQDIVNYRQQKGAFRSVNDLLKVKGIGPATLDKIKDLITVSD